MIFFCCCCRSFLLWKNESVCICIHVHYECMWKRLPWVRLVFIVTISKADHLNFLPALVLSLPLTVTSKSKQPWIHGSIDAMTTSTRHVCARSLDRPCDQRLLKRGAWHTIKAHPLNSWRCDDSLSERPWVSRCDMLTRENAAPGRTTLWNERQQWTAIEFRIRDLVSVIPPPPHTHTYPYTHTVLYIGVPTEVSGVVGQSTARVLQQHMRTASRYESVARHCTTANRPPRRTRATKAYPKMVTPILWRVPKNPAHKALNKLPSE